MSGARKKDAMRQKKKGKRTSSADAKKIREAKIAEQVRSLLGAKNPPPIRDTPNASLVKEEETLDQMISNLEGELKISDLDVPQDLLREFEDRLEICIGGNAKARIDLAIGWIMMGQWLQAKRQLKRIPAHQQHYWEAQCLLGQVYRQEKKIVKSMGVYKLCAKNKEASVEVRCEATYQLMEMYYGLGEVNKAFKLWDSLTQRFPGYRNLKEWKHKLKTKKVG